MPKSPPSQPSVEVDKGLQELLAKGHLVRGDDPRLVVQRVPIGIPQLDEILGGGLPRRRISILTGQYSGGKTILLQILMKNALAAGLTVAYIDTEQTYEPTWWTQVGLPLEKILVSQPAVGEDAIDVVMALVAANIDIIAIDSLAALVPAEEAEAEGKKKLIAPQARLIARLMRKLLSAQALINEKRSVIVCTNQLRDSIGPGPYDPMPGGVAQHFYTSLIIRVQREGWIEERGERVGYHMRVVCRKNKVARPFGECLLPFLFRGEIDLLSLLLDRAIEADLVVQHGAWFHLAVGGKELKGLGRNALITQISEDAELQALLEAALGEGKV